MIEFWDWVKSRQDARQWSEDELACAEIAWKEAVKEFKKYQQLQVELTMAYIERIGKNE